MTATLEVSPVPDEREPERHWPGTIVRGAALVLLVGVIAPAVVRTGDALAFPSVALVLLAECVVVIVSLAYWLVTKGAPAGWLAQHLRVTPDRFLITVASIFGVVSVIGLAWFRAAINRPRSALGQFDLRAASAAARLAHESDLMETLNSRGIRSMLVFGATFVIAAAVVGHVRSAALLALTLVVGATLVEFLKMAPPRPLTTLGLLTDARSSWPSGHAAFQGSIALGLVLWWWAGGLPRPSILAGFLIPLAALVGYSRAFLGVHWLSEVLSGWLVAITAAAIVLVLDRLITPRLPALPEPKQWRVIVAAIVALVVTVFAMQSLHRFQDHGPRGFHSRSPSDFPGYEFRAGRLRPIPEPTRIASSEPADVLGPLPHFTETMLGRRAQPLGLVVVGSGDRLRAAISQAGFTEAAPMTPKRLVPDFFAGLTGGADRSEPVRVGFYDAREPDLVAERREPGDRVGRRAEVWELPVLTPNECTVWAVTAARDKTGRFGLRTLYPTRRTASAIDTERDALADGLAGAGPFDDLGRFDFEGPMSGKYSTDGKVAVLRQPGC